MTHHPTLTATACGIAAAALLLTACGGAPDDASKIRADPTTSAPAVTATPPTTAPPRDANAPVFDFPKDVTIEIKMPSTGDKAKDAILRDHAYAIQAIQLAYVKQDPALPVFLKYTTGVGQLSWATNIKEYQDKDETVTGHMHYYEFNVTTSAADTAGVSYCEDQTESFDEDAKTGKVRVDTPDANSYVGWADLMKRSDDGTWRVANSLMKRGVASCRR